MVQLLQSVHGVNQSLVCEIKRCRHTFRGVNQAVLQDSGPLGREVVHDSGLVKVLGVKGEEEEKGEEEAAKKSEEVDSELVAHGAHIPANPFPDRALDPAHAIDVVS